MPNNTLLDQGLESNVEQASLHNFVRKFLLMWILYIAYKLGCYIWFYLEWSDVLAQGQWFIMPAGIQVAKISSLFLLYRGKKIGFWGFASCQIINIGGIYLDAASNDFGEYFYCIILFIELLVLCLILQIKHNNVSAWCALR